MTILAVGSTWVLREPTCGEVVAKVFLSEIAPAGMIWRWEAFGTGDWARSRRKAQEEVRYVMTESMAKKCTGQKFHRLRT
jgi:hypothetical protein